MTAAGKLKQVKHSHPRGNRMNKLKRAAASIAVTVAMVAGIPAAANAVTYSSPQKWQTGGTYCPVMMYADYNWWEETFLGKRDGWQLQYYAYC